MSDLWWTKWHWTGFTPITSAFPCQFHSTGAPLYGKTKKLIIFVTGLHNQPEGCGASVASAAGPFTKKNNNMQQPHFKNNFQVYFDNTCQSPLALLKYWIPMVKLIVTGYQYASVQLIWRQHKHAIFYHAFLTEQTYMPAKYSSLLGCCTVSIDKYE